jgi:hypothetical protein
MGGGEDAKAKSGEEVANLALEGALDLGRDGLNAMILVDALE